MRALQLKNPTLAYEQISKLNDILAFADDTLIYTESIWDIRRAIDGISLEIKRIGLEINPAKCSLLLCNVKPDELD